MVTAAKPLSVSSSLYCSQCGKEYRGSIIQTYATCCNKPLVANYFLSEGIRKEIINTSDLTMWRYAALLPVSNKKNIITLGEGMTPVLPLQKLASIYNIDDVILKDESFN